MLRSTRWCTANAEEEGEPAWVSMNPSASAIRLAFASLDQGRLKEICLKAGITAGRSKTSYLEALVGRDMPQHVDLLARLTCDELAAMSRVLGISATWRDKRVLVQRVRQALEASVGRANGGHSVPRPPSGATPQQLAFPLKKATPFVKWAGGKRQLLRVLREHLPQTFGTYYEPFVGGGALFFELLPRRAVLADSNARLIRAYLGVQHDVERVISLLREYPHTKDFFDRLKREVIDNAADAEVAAWLIYLNKTGYNGLYRVNSKNLFNVPYGRYARPNICDAENLRACAEALRGADVRCADFADATSGASRGDFVYFDPPYVPRSDSSYFTSYTARGFGAAEQERLRDVALALKRRGVCVLLSNSATQLVENLYSRHFELVPVMAKRRVSRDTGNRGAVKEYLIR
jgi:DNA adenine methylase